jgi:hypothetical protein
MAGSGERFRGATRFQITQFVLRLLRTWELFCTPPPPSSASKELMSGYFSTSTITVVITLAQSAVSLLPRRKSGQSRPILPKIGQGTMALASSE